MVLIIDERTDVSNLFIEYGFVPVRYSHWGINTGQTNTIGSELKAYRFSMVWVEYPKLINKQRRYAHMTCLVNWATLCKQLGVPFVLFGSFGKKWDDPQLIAAEDSGVFCKRHHRLCHYGLSVEPSLKVPSSVCFVSLSTFDTRAHPCRCEMPQNQHTMDIKESHERNRSKLIDSAQLKLVTRLLPDLLLVVNRTTRMNPTQNTSDTFTSSSAPVSTLQSDKPGDGGQEVPPPPSHQELTLVAKQLRDERKAKRKLQFSVIEPTYPTDAREKQKIAEKARKEAGIEKQTRKKFVENHCDDCGTDLSGLGPDAAKPFDSYTIEHCGESDDEPDEAVHMMFNLELFTLHGSEWNSSLHYDGNMHAHRVGNVCHMIQVLLTMGTGIDVAELCGGEARVSQICIRRRLKSGENFDIVSGCDLNEPSVQRDVRHYYNSMKPLFSIQAPTCTPFGPLGKVNHSLHYDSWLISYQNAAPHGRFCGEMALLQDKQGRFWLNEQPRGSWLYYEDPWPEVLARPNTRSKIVDQCMVGQTGPSGLPAKKPTEFKGNDEHLLQPLDNLTCDGSHDHESLLDGKAKAAQVWPWQLCRRIVDGMILAKRAWLKRQNRAYPAIPKPRGRPRKDGLPAGSVPKAGSGKSAPPTPPLIEHREKAAGAPPPASAKVRSPDDPRGRSAAVRPKGTFDQRLNNPYAVDPTNGQENWKKCPGCRNNKAWWDPIHDRSDNCKFQAYGPVHYDCTACQRGLPAASDEHLLNEGCRWTEKQHDLAKSLDRTTRHGRHPRMPARPSHGIPEGDLHPQLPDGTDLGEREEITHPEEDFGPHAEEAPGTPPLPDEVPAPRTPPTEGSDAIVPHRGAGRRGATGSSDIVPAHRAAFRDATAGTVEPYDWTRFNISNSMRACLLYTSDAADE